ncbi:hypothetical protein XccvBFoX1_gp53 [Xanthomonas phage FoX1]|uniref:Uncharacterized protein n=1 Tax=Xanthomonas phage FoX1 TaxID=2723897 RepID=A0A858NPC8_9CAUD|nr:hypothetical protein KNU93_gp57 [Xanthomonas phage FoX1]QJB21792.1 hypothetical protein XccvBFoX1_gp53 [Xanthomonas phage FoX1]
MAVTITQRRRCAALLGRVMSSKFNIGDRVQVVLLGHGDFEAGLSAGCEGVVYFVDQDRNGPHVNFDTIPQQPDNFFWKNGARYMVDDQLIKVTRLIQEPNQPEPVDHLAAVSAATLDYQRLLREYHRATLSRDVAQRVLDEAEKLLRDTGRGLRDAYHALKKAHYDAAGVPISPFQ